MLTKIKEQGDFQLMYEYLCMNKNTNYARIFRGAISIVLQFKKKSLTDILLYPMEISKRTYI